jgi:hypothetical protein
MKLACIMPYDKMDLMESEETIDIMEVTPDVVQHINTRILNWTEMLEREIKERCVKRCAQHKEHIMIKVWHPSRVERLLDMGYDMEDM